jgi:hypothetical protein
MNIGGRKVSNWWLIGGGVGVVAVIWVFRKNSGSPASPASATGTDPVTGLPYSQDSQVDPVTNMGYLAEAQQYGSVSAAEAAVTGGAALGSGYGLSGGSGGYYGTAGYPTSSTGSGSTGSGGYSSNAQWAQAVQAGLAGLGYDPQTVASALGLYLASMPLPAADASLVQAAIAEYGPPPVGSYPIIRSPSSGGGATIPVPDVKGMEQAQAYQVISSVGLKPSGPAPVKGKVHTVTAQSPKAGTHVAHGTTVHLTSKLS